MRNRRSLKPKYERAWRDWRGRRNWLLASGMLAGATLYLGPFFLHEAAFAAVVLVSVVGVVAADIRASNFLCPRCGNRFFPGGTYVFRRRCVRCRLAKWSDRG